MTDLKRTLFFQRDVALEARMVEFGGWEMPLRLATGPARCSGSRCRFRRDG